MINKSLACKGFQQFNTNYQLPIPDSRFPSNPYSLRFTAICTKKYFEEKILLQSKTVYICRSIKFKKNYHEQS